MDDRSKGVTRRGLLKGIATTAVASAAGGAAALADETRKAAPAQAALPVSIRLNGQLQSGVFEPRTTLAEALRETWGLTGTKIGCDRGACGACTVLLDGLPVNSCLTLVHDADGRNVTSVEGLGTPEAMSPVQKAFMEADGMQCGFCTPGMVVSAEALLRKNPNPTPGEIRAAVAGNICRCGTYAGVFAACEGARKGARHA
ncbi:MAG TPA: (2Fe-2S)-binding protein [Thermoanaerobaculia bacterium]|nr:(2Fe-2S)-binding protein [Thermoanaerobaculia bacterium]